MIELNALCKTYVLGGQAVHALDHVSLRVAAGDYLSVMGPSGSGKSTLLNMLGLLDRPDSGAYRLNGVDTATLGDEERARLRCDRIGFVFQTYHLIERLDARENIEVPMMLAGVPPAERRRRAVAVLDRLGLAGRAHHLPRQLSGGQRQRVALGRAVVRNPSLLLADEPTGNLDSQAGSEVIRLLEELNGDGICLLVVTHDAEVGRRARRQLRMRDGRLISDQGSGEGQVGEVITGEV